MGHFTKEQIQKINKTALADKHGCTSQYVGQVMSGARADQTDLAQAIIKDVEGILKVLEGFDPRESKQSTNEVVL